MSWRRWRVLPMSWSTSSLQPWPSMLFLKRCKIDRQRTTALLFSALVVHRHQVLHPPVLSNGNLRPLQHYSDGVGNAHRRSYFFPRARRLGMLFACGFFSLGYTIEGYAPLLESETLCSACLPSVGLVAFVYPSWLPVAMSCRSIRSARKCVSETNGLGAEARMSFHGVGNGCGGRPRLRFDNS